MGRWDSDSDSHPTQRKEDHHRRMSRSPKREHYDPRRSKHRNSLPTTNHSQETRRPRSPYSRPPRSDLGNYKDRPRHRHSHSDRDDHHNRYDSPSPPPRKRRRSYYSPDSRSERARQWSRSRSPEPSRRSRRDYDPPPLSPARSRSPPRMKRESPPSNRYRKRSRSPQRIKQESSPHDQKPKRSSGPLPSQSSAFQGTTAPAGKPPDEKKQTPNYAPSGLLAAETNTLGTTGIVLKYNEPPDARLPSPTQAPWRLFVFKGKDLLEEIKLFERTSWLLGRERAVADVLTEHPSCSKQHAVLQFRYTEKSVGEYGEKRGKVRLYVIDLESANGTWLNGDKVDGRRFVEVKSGDVVKFGESGREYVALLPPKE